MKTVYLKKKMVKIFSPFLRIFHWVMVPCIFVLFVTGLYIGNPGFGALVGENATHAVAGIFSMSFIRKVHFITGFILIGICVLRIYGFARYNGDRLLPKFWTRKYWDGLAWAIKHYLFIPQKERFYLRNSLARTAYATIYAALVIMILTGIALFAKVEPNSWLSVVFEPINATFGEFNVHLIHHYVAWYFIIFVVIHVYMAFRADYKEEDGEISAMVTGYKFYDELPWDAEDLGHDFMEDRDEQYHELMDHPGHEYLQKAIDQEPKYERLKHWKQELSAKRVQKH